MHRWAGGKRWLVDLLLETLPPARRLIVPFYGGGGDSHPMIETRRYDRYLLGDVNEELVRANRAVAEQTDEVLRLLRGFARFPEELQRTEFARYRKKIPSSDAGRALRFFVLVGCGFNGLWRENSSGQFNAPWGKRFSFDESAVREVAFLLRQPGVELRVADFAETVGEAGDGDVVYADPPYLPEEGAAGCHDSYAGKRFLAEDHARLSAALQNAARRGAACFLSNHDSRAVRETYPGEVRVLEAPRRIAADPSRRGNAREVLIRISGGT